MRLTKLAGAPAIGLALVLATLAGCASNASGGRAGSATANAASVTSGAPAASDQYSLATRLADHWGSGITVVGDYAVTGAQLREYIAARAQATITTGTYATATSASLCILDGSFDPQLPIAPPLPGATPAPARTYSRVSIIVTDGQARVFQIGSPEDISTTISSADTPAGK